MKLHYLIFTLIVSTKLFSQNYIYTPTPIQNGNEEFGLKAATGNSRHVISFSLPENTVKWYYVYFASRNPEDVKNIEQAFNLVGKLSNYVDKFGIASDVMQQIGKPPSFNACDAIFLDSRKDVDVFETKGDYLGKKYMMVKEFSKTNSISGIVEVTDQERQTGWQFIGFRNPSAFYGVTVKVQVVAIVKTEEEKNGWTKTAKEEMYNGIKKNLDNAPLNISQDFKEKITTCALENLTKKYTPQAINGLTSYELSDVMNKIAIGCITELKKKK